MEVNTSINQIEAGNGLSPYAVMALSAGYGFSCQQLVGNGTTNNIKSDWISTTVLDTLTPWGTITDQVWNASTVRSLGQNIYSYLQQNVKSRTQAVNHYSTKEYNVDVTSTESLAIPSHREMNFGGITMETNGPVYSGVYINDQTRIKRNASGSAVKAWTRTIPNFLQEYAYLINTSGSYSPQSSSQDAGFCPLFHLN